MHCRRVERGQLGSHTIRDGCFRWYFSWWKSADLAEKYPVALRESGLPFQLEHHETGYLFIVAKGQESEYEQLIGAVTDQGDTSAV
jgi:hypothetical protein